MQSPGAAVPGGQTATVHNIGLAYDGPGWVYSTTFTAANLGYTPVVVSDCVASMRGEDSHEMALEFMALSFAWVMPGD